VLCHVRIIGISGMGLKAPDLLGAWGCSDCHDVVDGRAQCALSPDDVENAFLRGVIRTQAELIRLGKVKA